MCTPATRDAEDGSGARQAGVDQHEEHVVASGRQFERHFSAYTSRCYGADLRQFCQFLLGIPAEIMPDDVEMNGHANGNGHVSIYGHRGFDASVGDVPGRNARGARSPR